MNQKKPTDADDRVVALAALAASYEARNTSCPTDEELAAFIDDHLSRPEKGRILAHLNQCSDCYHTWLELATYDATMELDSIGAVQVSRAKAETVEEEKPQTPAPYKSSNKLAIELKRLLEALIGNWQITIPATIVGIVMIALAVSPGSLSIETQINERYAATIKADGPALTSIVRSLSLPWDTAALGFSPNESPNEKRAFAAGLWSGRAALLQGETMPLPEGLASPDGQTWEESPWSDYFSYGRWSVLLWAHTQSKEIPAHWDNHAKMLKQLRDVFDTRPSEEPYQKEAVATLDRLQPLLERVRNQGETQDYTALNRALLMTMERLTPRSL